MSSLEVSTRVQSHGSEGHRDDDYRTKSPRHHGHYAEGCRAQCHGGEDHRNQTTSTVLRNSVASVSVCHRPPSAPILPPASVVPRCHIGTPSVRI